MCTYIESPIPFNIFEIELVLLCFNKFTNMAGCILTDELDDLLPRCFEVLLVPFENHADIENVLFLIQPKSFSTIEIKFG